MRRLCFFGKSVRENASSTVSAFQASSKYGNTSSQHHNLILKVDVIFSIKTGGTADILFIRPENTFLSILGAFYLLILANGGIKNV